MASLPETIEQLIEEIKLAPSKSDSDYYFEMFSSLSESITATCQHCFEEMINWDMLVEELCEYYELEVLPEEFEKVFAHNFRESSSSGIVCEECDNRFKQD